MTLHPLETLVHDAARLTGTDLPAVLSDASPTLSISNAAAPPPFYLVGLIGGKDVGKSSLARAIAGVELGTPSNTGEGTREAIAYTHVVNANAVRELLERVVPNRFQIVTHEHAALRSQVLVDLPDIDSKYEDHIDLTRSVLRHLLFPIFVQSIEKYADQRPQQLLAQVAQGNDPANFVFLLNKVDQLAAREGTEATQTLAADYGRRLRTLLKLPGEPKVYRVSAVDPLEFDLPALRQTLARERDGPTVKRSLELASQRRHITLVRWLESQRLDDKLAHADRMGAFARELAQDKLLDPLHDRVLPRLAEDATLRGEIVDAAARRRIARWPIVNVIDVLLSPLTLLFRRGVAGLSTTRGNVRAIVAELTPPIDANVRSLFADLRRRDPSIAEAYDVPPPWDDASSESAAAELAGRLGDAMDERKRRLADQIGRGHGSASAPLRWLMTLGAVLWFPIVQPLLEIVLAPGWTWTGFTQQMAWQIVQLLGTTYLLKSVSFLAIYFALLWATLHYVTTKRAERLMSKFDDESENVSPAREASAWVENLLAPIDARTAELRGLVERVNDARSSVQAA